MEGRKGTDDIKVTREICWNVVIRRNPVTRSYLAGAVSFDIGSIADENSYGSGGV